MKSSPSSPKHDELSEGEDVPIKGLAARTIAGALWTSVGAIAEFLLHGIVLVILARLLSPEDFGIYALGTVVVGFSRVFGEVGLGPSVIQRSQLGTAHIRTAFTSTLILSVLTTLAVAALAPLLASLLGSPRVAPVIRALSLLFLIRGSGLVASSLLQRDMRFPELARTEVLSYLVGYGVVGTALAFAGLGYWALVWAALIQASMQSLQFLILRPHAKRLGIDRHALKDLFSFGAGASAGRLGNYLAMKGDYLVVGRLLGVAPLGIYSRAYELMAMPVGLYQSVANKALFSAVAKVQDDRKRLARAYSRAAAVTALILLPTGLALSVLAPEVIHVVLGPKWTAVVAPMQITALGMFFRGGYSVGAAVARGAGDVHQLALRQWAYAVLVIIGAWAGHYYGVTGVAMGVMLAVMAHFLIVSHLSMRSSELSWRQFASAHVPALTLGSVVLVSVTVPAYAMRSIGSPAVLTLLLSATFTLAITLVLLRRLPRVILGREGMWALDSIRQLLPQGARIVLPRRKRRAASPNRPIVPPPVQAEGGRAERVR